MTLSMEHSGHATTSTHVQVRLHSWVVHMGDMLLYKRLFDTPIYLPVLLAKYHLLICRLCLKNAPNIGFLLHTTLHIDLVHFPRDRALLGNISPALNPEKLTVPLLLAHGKHDFRVHYEQAEHLLNALASVGQTPTVLSFDNEGHLFSKKRKYRNIS